jgi:hypothetical protein
MSSTRKTVSTKRIDPDGVIHEMADRGYGTICGTQLPEPWIWTNKRVTCSACRGAAERELSDPDPQPIPIVGDMPVPLPTDPNDYEPTDRLRRLPTDN